jgi:hypothetical protein
VPALLGALEEHFGPGALRREAEEWRLFNRRFTVSV